MILLKVDIFMKKVLVSSLLLGLFSSSYACNIYIQFDRESDTYVVSGVGDTYRNKKNTLVTSYDVKNETFSSLSLGYCSGDFGNRPFSKSYGAFMLTMGFMGDVKGAPCEQNEENYKNITIANKTSHFESNPLVLKEVEQCISDSKRQDVYTNYKKKQNEILEQK
jgi:hypothetical protein